MFPRNKTVMPFPTISRDTSFVIGAHAKSKRGQTYATINSDQNSVYQLASFDSPLLVPFAAGVFQEKGDETRINLDAVIEGELLQEFARWTRNLSSCSRHIARRALTILWSHAASTALGFA